MDKPTYLGFLELGEVTWLESCYERETWLCSSCINHGSALLHIYIFSLD